MQMSSEATLFDLYVVHLHPPNQRKAIDLLQQEKPVVDLITVMMAL